MKPILLRLYRAGVLVVIVWLIHAQHAWRVAQRDATLTVAQAHDFFPEAASLGSRDPQSALQRVLNAEGDTLGWVTQTAPQSDRIIGYSGPTNTLIALDAQSKIIGLRILHSDDTAEHLATVLRTRKFFSSFIGWKSGSITPPKIDAVSGATLTSTAITQGILERLGKQSQSLRFPEVITLDEVRALKPDAAELQATEGRRDVFRVLDAKRNVIAQVTRTAPESDGVIGYKGPTDSLLLLSADGMRVEAFRVRKSYDTTEYVGYVTGDKFFTHVFDGMEMNKLSALDFNAAKIEGVSGATETSWSVAEGLKRKTASLLVSQNKNLESYFKKTDVALLGVILFSLIMAFTKLRGQRYARWFHQALLIGYAGLYSGSLLSQGMLTGWAQHGVPWQSASALVLLAALALALPLFTRHQFYCHHYCPHGALQQWLAHRIPWQLHVSPRVGRWLEKLPAALLIFIIIAVMLGWSVNLNALEPFDAWLIRIAGWGTLTVAALGLMASLFAPMSYCRYGCPTGALLKFMRYTGEADHFGKRDAAALGLVALVIALYLMR